MNTCCRIAWKSKKTPAQTSEAQRVQCEFWKITIIEVGNPQFSEDIACTLLNPDEEHEMQDLFSKGDSIDQVGGNDTDWERFISYLNYSDWSKWMMHWADMLPWMCRCFSRFLEKQWSSLWDIKNIKFKKKVNWDLIYTIRDHDRVDAGNASSVCGKFNDNNNKEHFFYGTEIKQDREPLVCTNIIPLNVLACSSEESLCKLQNMVNAENIILPLREQDTYNTEPYIQKMEENEWYTRATILDIINISYQLKFNSSWLVISYENLSIDKEKFSPEQLFDWSCEVHSSMLWDSFKLWNKWYWYKCTFGITHHTKGEVVSWIVTFFKEG